MLPGCGECFAARAVRIHRMLLRTLIRLWFRTLSALAPRVAARQAARLWFRVAKPNISSDARAFLATGERFETSTRDCRVVGWAWGRGPTVLLMHGWGGYAAQLQQFVQ